MIGAVTLNDTERRVALPNSKGLLKRIRVRKSEYGSFGDSCAKIGLRPGFTSVEAAPIGCKVAQQQADSE